MCGNPDIIAMLKEHRYSNLAMINLPLGGGILKDGLFSILLNI
jgi:hypothetical protein